jgi:hypothetical protein
VTVARRHRHRDSDALRVELALLFRVLQSAKLSLDGIHWLRGQGRDSVTVTWNQEVYQVGSTRLAGLREQRPDAGTDLEQPEDSELD